MQSGQIDGTLTLEQWQLVDTAGDGIPKADITALTFTIVRSVGGGVVGTENRNGLDSNGVTVSTLGRVTHVISTTDNAPANSGASEGRRIHYKYTLTDGSYAYKTVDYWLQSLSVF